MKKLINITATSIFFLCFQFCFAQVPISNENVSWASYRDLSSEKFSKKFKEYSDKGYLMIDVDAYAANGKILYAMVWQKNTDKRGWAEHRDMTSDKYHERWTEYNNKGYRPIDVEAYKKNGKILYAGIWIQNKEGLAWSSKRNLSSSQYSTYFKNQSDKGFRVIDIEVYKIGSKTRYAAIWIKNNDNLAWAQYRNMTRENYQKRVNEFSAKGYIVEDYERYKTGSKTRYAAIWVKRSGIQYQVRTNRSERDYANLWREYNDKGYRLVDFEREGNSYAGIWVQNNTNILSYQHKTKLNNLISAYQTTNNLPGLSVAIIENGQMLYKRGFGFANINDNKKAWSRTVYLQASVSKVIGGTIATKLASNGRLENGKEITLDLGENTATYLTNIKTSSGKTVSLPVEHEHTVEQLFSHLSCIRHYSNGPEPIEKHYTKAIDALTQIWDASFFPNCTVGTSRNYSTHALTYAAAVLEAVSGQSTAQLIENEIAKPYNLSSMRAMYGKKNLPKNYERAQAYSSANNKINYQENSWKIFGGGIESSTSDLARFGWKVLNGEIINATDRDSILWTRVNPNEVNGIGWQIRSSGNIIDHEGLANGARSILRIHRAENVVIAINTNRRAGSLDGLADNIANIILN